MVGGGPRSSVRFRVTTRWNDRSALLQEGHACEPRRCGGKGRCATLENAFGPYLRRLSDPEPLVYSVRQAAHVLATSTTTVRRLVEQGVLPTVPHLGQRIVIPRVAVADLVASGRSVAPRMHLHVADQG